jgi:hypothetical protein
MDDHRLPDMDESTTLSWAELRAMAVRLYGTDADLWTVLWVPEGQPSSGDVREQLRRRLNLVQDPVTGIWLCPVEPRRASPPTSQCQSSPMGEESGSS